MRAARARAARVPFVHSKQAQNTHASFPPTRAKRWRFRSTRPPSCRAHRAPPSGAACGGTCPDRWPTSDRPAKPWRCSARFPRRWRRRPFQSCPRRGCRASPSAGWAAVAAAVAIRRQRRPVAPVPLVGGSFRAASALELESSTTERAAPAPSKPSAASATTWKRPNCCLVAAIVVALLVVIAMLAAFLNSNPQRRLAPPAPPPEPPNWPRRRRAPAPPPPPPSAPPRPPAPPSPPPPRPPRPPPPPPSPFPSPPRHRHRRPTRRHLHPRHPPAAPSEPPCTTPRTRRSLKARSR